jgi:hypothetical protein
VSLDFLRCLPKQVRCTYRAAGDDDVFCLPCSESVYVQDTVILSQDRVTHSQQWPDAVWMTKVNSQERPPIKLVCCLTIHIQRLTEMLKNSEI